MQEDGEDRDNLVLLFIPCSRSKVTSQSFEIPVQYIIILS